MKITKPGYLTKTLQFSKAVFALTTITLLISCGKEKVKLPPETQSGALTMGFKIDGKVFTAKGRYGILCTAFPG